MTYYLNEEQRAFVDVAREFAREEIRPRAAYHDETAEFPWDAVERSIPLGLYGFDVAEEFGGTGVTSLLTCCLLMEELAWGDSAIAAQLISPSFFSGPIEVLGTDEQKRTWIPPLLSGPRPVIGALAVTEPHAGSDVGAMTSFATACEGGFRLNGHKIWISCAPVAKHYLVFARTTKGTGSRGISGFIVTSDDPGFSAGKPLAKMGQRAHPAAELFFDDLFLPEDRLVGELDNGYRSLVAHFTRTRCYTASSALGVGRAALDYAVEYAANRKAFGKSISDYQAVSFRLVDARMKLDQARLMVHHAAQLADAGLPFATESSMAKLAASEAAFYAAWACCQTLGGYGFSKEYPAEKWLRDAKLEEIYEGTSDIQRLIISRSMFGRGGA